MHETLQKDGCLAARRPVEGTSHNREPSARGRRNPWSGGLQDEHVSCSFAVDLGRVLSRLLEVVRVCIAWFSV